MTDAPFKAVLKIAARDSRLSRAQVTEVLATLGNIPSEVSWVKSYGDVHKDISLLDDTTPADIFTRELDQLVLAGEVDVAVHSAKDLPYPLAQGLRVLAITAGKDPRDVLVTRDGATLTTLRQGARMGTSSPLRRESLLALRPDLEIVGVRGTIEERLALVDSGYVDGLVVAACALERLGLAKRITEVLSFKTHDLQGRLAVVARHNRVELEALLRPLDVRRSWGQVTLAGAGPGDPDLLTIKAAAVLSQADTVFYDDLVDERILSLVKNEMFYVGKRKACHSYAQQDINRLLYETALAGKQVVRLKGGDPFIFGRGGEEMDYLQERQITVTIIPGISAASAAAAAAGIPLTYREISSSLALCTGHPPEKIQTPSADTLVYYMAATGLKGLAEKLVRSGWPLFTPVTLVRNAACPGQEIYTHCLQDLSEKTLDYESPLVMIVGQVAAKRLSSPLGKVLVTGTEAGKYEHWGEVTHTPLITLKLIQNIPALGAAIDQAYDIVLFTSRYAVQFWMELLLKEGRDARWFAGKRIFSIGRVTSKALRSYGLQADLQAEEESSTGVLALFRKENISGQHVFVPRSDKALDIIPQGLKAMACVVAALPIYTNSMPDDPCRVNLDTFGTVVFSSPSAVQNFLTLYKQIPAHMAIVARGSQTSAELAQQGYQCI